MARAPAVSRAVKALQPQLLEPFWATSCTISCESDPTVSCTSAKGNCSYYWGAYDYIICDGVSTRCPL